MDCASQKTNTIVADAALLRQYAFTGVERMGAVFAYDIADPTAPKFVRHANTKGPGTSPDDESGELDIESVIVVNTTESPLAGSAPMRIVGNGILGTVGVFAVSAA